MAYIKLGCHCVQQVDCTAEVQLCRDHIITGFPSIRVFRKGSDEVSTHGMRDHESYRGDRTTDALLAFAENLVPSAGQPHHFIRYMSCTFCCFAFLQLHLKNQGVLAYLSIAYSIA